MTMYVDINDSKSHMITLWLSLQMSVPLVGGLDGLVQSGFEKVRKRGAHKSNQ